MDDPSGACQKVQFDVLDIDRYTQSIPKDLYQAVPRDMGCCQREREQKGKNNDGRSVAGSGDTHLLKGSSMPQ